MERFQLRESVDDEWETSNARRRRYLSEAYHRRKRVRNLPVGADATSNGRNSRAINNIINSESSAVVAQDFDGMLVSLGGNDLFIPERQDVPSESVRLAVLPFQGGIIARHRLGRMERVCSNCEARLWVEERMYGTSQRTPKFSICCASGKVVLAPLQDPPQVLYDLLIENDGKSRRFREKIRGYNSALAFTSMGANIDESLIGGSARGIYSFRLHGEMYHRIGTLLPDLNLENGSLPTPKFAQLYIYDTDNEINNRMRVMPGLDEATLRELQEMLHSCNPYVEVLSQARDMLRQDPLFDLSMVIKADRATMDVRRYNAPVASEVAAIMVGSEDQDIGPRDIVVRSREGNFRRISELNRAYTALHYVLLFPRGDDGWHTDIPLVGVSGSSIPLDGHEGNVGVGFGVGNTVALDETDHLDGKRGRVSQMQFYSYQLQVRSPTKSLVHLGGRLFQQWVVDVYASMEQNRLRWLRFHQDKIRSDLYQGLQDAVQQADMTAAGVSGLNVGKRIVLPSSFIGGPRHMHQLFQDAMAIVRNLGKPDLFITFTCNPKWPEITEELLANQHSSDRPDLSSRVFKLKLKELMNDILVKNVFGKVIGYIYVVEFQKRGLPHAHILIILAARDKLNTTEEYDRVVSAELPDPSVYPLAFETVKTMMMHGPCGIAFSNAPCMENRVCTKRYPRSFQSSTAQVNDGYPVYQRRDDGRSVDVRGTQLDNRWVVPHNLYLATKYNAHINVEVCSSIGAVKYLYKYVYKGHDRATVQLGSMEQEDEIKIFLDARYVSASEASWRILSFRLHDEKPDIQRLQVHLPNEQSVTFTDGEDLLSVLNRPNIGKTTLTQWFKINSQNTQARNLTYADFPTQWVWKNDKKEWKPRQRGNTIGRLYFVPPTAGESFYLRMLLTKVKGATSYENLREVDGVVHESFRLACAALGMLQDDKEWDDCLHEAGLIQSGAQLRRLFLTMLLFCQPTYPEQLWEKHIVALTDDLLIQMRLDTGDASLEATDVDLSNRALLHLDSMLLQQGKSLKDFPNMPIPTAVRMNRPTGTNRLIQEEQCYNSEALAVEVNEFVLSLNEGQKVVFDAVMNAIENSTPASFFIDGPGGSGKTFLYNTLLSKVRASGYIALAVASSGIAALLLKGGRTAHSRLRLPVNLDESSTCSIKHNTELGDLLKAARLIVWDEAPMMHKHAFEAVDRTLKDLMKAIDPALESLPFGGKVVVFGGDFRQVLPVVRKGGREDIVAACFRRSRLWAHVRVMKLTTNMRLRQAQNASDVISQQAFASWLLEVGEGRVPAVEEGSDAIKLPEDVVFKANEEIDDLINFVYPNLADKHVDANYLVERGVLAPKNDDVDNINEIVLAKFPGQVTEFLSADSLDLQEGSAHQDNLYPVEFLNSMKVNGLPSHKISLKVGAPIMLLRNLNAAEGLCNGTRMICRRFSRCVIEAEVVDGTFAGSRVFIPRITLIPTTVDLPFVLKRRQFPIRLAFGMTINKAQGQTLSKVGIYLPNPVFAHGQLYVALSRVKSKESVKVLVKSECHNITRNVVYPEVL